MAKMRVAVLFGGMSSEYEISCLSAAGVVDNMDPERYDVVKIGITKKGRWLHYPGGTDGMRDDSWHQSPDCTAAFISPDRTTRGLFTQHGAACDVTKLDMVFPVLHGKSGEDGTIQGLLELAGIPYVGCGVAASANCMDKTAANLIFEAAGLPHTPWLAASRAQMDDFDGILFRLNGHLRYPVFVKPAAAGSSIGVTKVTGPEELRNAMLLASAHGSKIVLEQAVDGMEVECAVMGNALPFATLPGEIESCHEVYDYDAKYHSGGESKLFIPARLPQEKLLEVRDMALKAYRALGCAGLSRVDFFVERDSGRVLLNEINTMPGFTPISMFPKLMDYSGISFPDLIDRLILYAKERAEG